MASAFVDDMKETYLGRVEEISPNIRYCAYNIGDESAIGDLMQMRLKGATGGDIFTSSLDVSVSGEVDLRRVWENFTVSCYE